MIETPPTPAPLPAAAASRPVPASPRGGEVNNQVRVLSVLVEDGSNTLSKISGLIRRRGFHVRSISVGPSPQPGRSRMTLTVDAGHAETDQVRKQLERLVEVIGMVRDLDLKKPPSIAESIDWARALLLLGADDIDADVFRDTMSIIVKHRTDLDTVAERVGVKLSDVNAPL